MNKNQKIVTALACIAMLWAVATTPATHLLGDNHPIIIQAILAQRIICVFAGWGALFILAGLWKGGKKP